MKNFETDIVIIGAGVGGCIAALALSSQFSVTLVDTETLPPPRVGESLPPEAERLMEQLGLAHLLTRPGYLPCEGIHSYWGNENADVLKDAKRQEINGWHVCRQAFEMELRKQVQNRGVNCLWPYALGSSLAENNKWHLVLHELECSSPKTLICNAKIVIDASGRLSTFAQQQGVVRQDLDHLVSSWVTFCSDYEGNLSAVHPVENGWWYSAPIPQLPFLTGTEAPTIYRGSPRLLAFHTDNDLLPCDYALAPQALLSAASEIAGLKDVLDNIEPQSVVHHGVVSVNSSRLTAQYGEGWFAIGDAAMSFDPLVAQGMFNAMACAMQLSELINKFGIDSEVSTTTISCQFQQQLDRLWIQLARSNQNLYAQERRWLNNAFWERRAAL